LDVDFRDVTGIRVHSEVRYAGASAGEVSAVRLLTADERLTTGEEQKRNAVRVTLTLRKDLPPVPADTRVSLSSDTLLGEKFVALSAGSASAPKLANGALLQGHGSGSIDTLIEAIGPLVESITPLVESLQPLVKTADEALRGVHPLLQKTGDVMDSVKTDTLPRFTKLADTADEALKRIDKLLTEVDDPIKADLVELKRTLVQTEQTLATADQMLARTDRNLNPRLQELGVVLQNLKVVSTHAKALTQALGEKPNRLIFSGKPQKLTPEDEILRSPKPLPAVQQ
jgi:ABC-type transporter Mla subunit MlaD